MRASVWLVLPLLAAGCGTEVPKAWTPNPDAAAPAACAAHAGVRRMTLLIHGLD